MRFARSSLVTAGIVGSVAAASAAPLPAAKGLAGASQSQVVPVHGWHRFCEWGPFRYHRHIPGVGNVRCYRGPRFRGGWCRRWRNECADRWGWGNWRFRRCMRRHGC